MVGRAFRTVSSAEVAGAVLSRWDGASWRRVRKPDSFGDLDLVEDVAAADYGEMWALIRDGWASSVAPCGGTTGLLIPAQEAKDTFLIYGLR